MSSSATSAKATTSARRMTGGSSLLASGSGVPAGSLGGTPSLGRTRTTGSPPRKGTFERSREVAPCEPNSAHQPARFAKVPSSKREEAVFLTDSSLFEQQWNRTAPLAFVVRSINVMHIERGSSCARHV